MSSFWKLADRVLTRLAVSKTVAAAQRAARTFVQTTVAVLVTSCLGEHGLAATSLADCAVEHLDLAAGAGIAAAAIAMGWNLKSPGRQVEPVQ